MNENKILIVAVMVWGLVGLLALARAAYGPTNMIESFQKQSERLQQKTGGFVAQ